MNKTPVRARPALPLLTLATLLALTGCGPTKVVVEKELPPTCIIRIAVIPFEHSNEVDFGKDLANHATMTITNQLREMKRHFTLVDNPDSADAVVSGKMVQAYSVRSERLNPLKKKTYYTKVFVKFYYSLKIAKDGETRYINQNGSSEKSSQWPYSITNGIMKDAINNAMGDQDYIKVLNGILESKAKAGEEGCEI